MAPAADVHELLTANSMKNHYLLMGNDIFQVHVTQGIVALHRLGAPLDRIQKFIDSSDTLGDGLVKASEKGYVPGERYVISDKEAAALLGKYKSYYKLVNYYDLKLKKQYGGSVNALIKGEMKKLGDGIISDVTHAIIEMGHGFSVGQTEMVVEGMAWLHYGYLAPGLSKQELCAPFPRGPLSVTDMLTHLSGVDRLKELARQTTKPGPAGIDARIKGMWVPESRTLLEVLNQTDLEIPADARQAGTRLVDIALLVYMACRKRNEFFILHGVTGAWSVAQILPVLDEETARMVVRTQLMLIVGLYVMEASPPLDFSLIPAPGDVNVGWPEIIERAIAFESPDPHCYKVVQVCYDLARSAPPEMQSFYKAGALVILDYPRSFFDSDTP